MTAILPPGTRSLGAAIDRRLFIAGAALLLDATGVMAGPTAERPSGGLSFGLIDLVAPWIPAPQTILFVADAADARAIWAGWLPAVVDRYRIIRVDHYADDRSAAFDRGAAELFATADAGRANRIHVVGGTIGLRLAALRPDRVASVTVRAAQPGGGLDGFDPAAIRVPVLILGDDRPGAVGPMAAMRARLPDARLAIFPQAGQGVAACRGKAYGKSLRIFLDSLA